MPRRPNQIWTQYWENYLVLVKNNPLIATEVENVLRWMSYLLSGSCNLTRDHFLTINYFINRSVYLLTYNL